MTPNPLPDDEVEKIKVEKFATIKDSNCIVIEQPGPDWIIHQWTRDSVMPISVYMTPRLAAARALQLLKIGPVRPQDHPETVGINSIEIGSADDTA